MIQGDKYCIGVSVTQGGTVITPSLVTDVIIKLGNVVKHYASGEIEFSTENNTWVFPVTQAQTLAMSTVMFQVQVVLATGDIVNSVPQSVAVTNAVIREEYANA